MKAVLLRGYGGVDQLDYTDAPDPRPAQAQVLVRVIATSVNPIDYKLRSGAMKDFLHLKMPVILGRDVAGEVAALGDGVTAFKIGELVMGLVNQSYAEYLVADARDLASVPTGLDPQQAGVLPLVTITGAQLMEHGVEPRSGETILVTGAAGGVGRTAAFVGKQHGAIVIAGVLARQLEAAKNSIAADKVVALDDDRGISQLPELDAIADTIDGDTIAKLIPRLRKSGRLASVLGKPAAAAKAGIGVRDVFAHPDPDRMRQLAEAYRDGKLNIPIAARVPLSDIRRAHQLAEKGADGKIAVLP